MHDTVHFMIGNSYKLVIEHHHEVGSGVTKEEHETRLCGGGKDDAKVPFMKEKELSF